MTRTTRCTRLAASAGQRSRTSGGGGSARFSSVLGSALVDLGCPGRVLWSSWWAAADLVDVVCLLDDDLSCWCRGWSSDGGWRWWCWLVVDRAQQEGQGAWPLPEDQTNFHNISLCIFSQTRSLVTDCLLIFSLHDSFFNFCSISEGFSLECLRKNKLSNIFIMNTSGEVLCGVLAGRCHCFSSLHIV